MEADPTSAEPERRAVDGAVAGTGSVQRRLRGPFVGGYWLLLPLLGAQLLVAFDLDVPVVRPVLALATMLGLPTLLLHRRAGFPADTAVTRLAYSFGASLLAVILLGLLVNTVLPLVGVDHPLQPAVLAATWLLVDTSLLCWRAHIPALPPIAWGRLPRRALDARFELAQGLAAGGVLAAVVGAVRLNNGAGGTVAVLAVLLAAAALLALLAVPAGTLGRDARCLALVAAGLLLATSLRGWYITGHDIQAEYLAFQLTDTAQRWQMDSLQNAYNACLSINILPTVLAQTTGLSGLLVFKLLLQLVFALVPVLTYLFSRRFVSRRLGLVAAVLTMAFPTFFTDMPYLVRQEVAFFFLGLLLLAATEPGGRRTWLRPMVAVLGVGVVLSHYSTTYLMLIGLVLALVVRWMARLAGTRLRLAYDGSGSPFRMVLLNPLVFAFLLAASFVWAGPVTHTGGHASDVVRTTVDTLTGRGTDGPGSSDASYRLFSRDQTTPRERLDLFVRETNAYRETRPRSELLIRKPGRAELRPEIVPTGTAPLTALGERLDSLGLAPATLNTAAKVGCAVLMQVFLLLGLLRLLRRGKDGPHVPPEVAYLSFGVAGALGLVVLVPNLSVDYGVLRAFQQSLLVLAPVLAAGMWLLLRRLGSRVGTGLAVALPLVLLLVLSGALPAMLGADQPRVALRNSGIYYDRFYASDPEIRAVAWVSAVDQASGWRSRIIANRNIAVRLLSASDNAAPVADRLYPTLLARDSYVFLDRQILEKGRSTVFYTGDLINYVYPVRDLDRRLDVVYSSPGGRIYR